MPRGRCCDAGFGQGAQGCGETIDFAVSGGPSDSAASSSSSEPSEPVAESVSARKPCCRRRGGGGGALVEPAALAALLVEGGHGYDLRRVILERTNGALDVDVGGLYRSLRRLEDEGAVVSTWSEDESGPRRREYETTDQGVELAEQWLEALHQRQRLDGLIIALLEGGLSQVRAQRQE